MKLGEAAKLFSANCIWRVSGAKTAGRILIGGLTSADGNNRLIAATLLVRGGKMAVPLFREALERGAVSPLLLRVIGDSGMKEFVGVLERFSSGTDPRLAQAAADALRVLSIGAGAAR